MTISSETTGYWGCRLGFNEGEFGTYRSLNGLAKYPDYQDPRLQGVSPDLLSYFALKKILIGGADISLTMSDHNPSFTCSTCRRTLQFASFGTSRQGNRYRTCGRCCARSSARYHERHPASHYRPATEIASPSAGPSIPQRPRRLTIPGHLRTSAHAIAIRHAEATTLPIGRTSQWMTRTVAGTSIHFTLSPLSMSCLQCKALHFLEERISSSSVSSPRFSACCLDGKVSLPAFATPSASWQAFFNREHAHSTTFLNNIHEYNNSFSFLSLRVSFDLNVMRRSGPYVFRIQGQLAHLMGSLTTRDSPRYAQIYMLGDPDAQVQARLRGSSLSSEVIRELQEELLAVNPYAQQWRFAFERLAQISNTRYLAISLLQTRRDPRRYNLPTTPTEVAAVILRENDEEFTRGREFIAEGRTGRQLSRFDELHPANMPLRFVLFFPAGDQGWHPTIPRTAITGSRERVTQKEFYAYHLFTRSNSFNIVHRGSALFHEWIVDSWVQTEANRLRYLRLNQAQLRSDLYGGIMDNISSDNPQDPASIGRRFILPSSFVGGNRSMVQLYQDAMTLCRVYGKPDLFVTITCNPNWPDIARNLLPGQSSTDRPALITRVFKLRLHEILRDILKVGVLGSVVAYVGVTEFQKRGLPHFHLLLFLDLASKLHNPIEYDSIVSAEIPAEDQSLELYNTVTRNMLHYCDTRCLVNAGCKKGFPKDWAEETTAIESGYPVYRRRRELSRVFTRRIGGHDVSFTHQHVVPYNPYLCAKYDCHINVEICCSFRAVKYLFKYVFKGSDRVLLHLSRDNHEDIDEISAYTDTRYVSAPEAAYRIFGFPLHESAPPIQRLQVHLPDQQVVTFNDGEVLAAQVEHRQLWKTTLTEFFEACRREIGNARCLLYIDMPAHFIWDATAKEWRVRRRGCSIGRMPIASPQSGDRFFLRILLCHVRGPTSFSDLRTVNRLVYPTFRAACQARGLINDDQEYDDCLREATGIQTGPHLRSLFVIILCDCTPLDPYGLWDKYKQDLADDCKNRLQHFGIPNPTDDQAIDHCLCLLSQSLRIHDRSLSDFFLPVPNQNLALNPDPDTAIVLSEQELEARVSQLSQSQYHAYSAVTSSVESHSASLFFLDGPGGTGKTTVIRLILGYIQSCGYTAIAVASTGIAAQLLPNGRTAHS